METPTLPTTPMLTKGTVRLASPLRPLSAWTTVALVVAFSLRVSAIPAVPTPSSAASVDEAQAAQIGARMSQLVESIKTHRQTERAMKVAQGAPAQKLSQEASEDVQIHLRPGNQTVAQIRGSRLESAAPGVGKTALDHSAEARARAFLRRHRELLRLQDPDQELTLASKHQDELGHQHLRFRQAFKGVPVWPTGLTVHFDRANELTGVEAAYVPTPDLVSVTPTLTAEQAAAKANALVTRGLAKRISVPELIIYAPLNRAPRLAWKVELTVSLAEGWLAVIDANDGSLLRKENRVLDSRTSGSGIDLGGASRSLNVWQQGSTYYLVDTSKQSFDPAFDPLQDPHGAITIADAQEAPADQVLQATVPTVSSASATAWEIPASISAAYNFSQTYDYYLQHHNRNSLDGQGCNITAIVRVGNYDNASWHGNLRLMLFGDVQPYAGSLDVVGHELTHGVTETSAALVYENQSGALNEAFSDIFGEMVELHARGHNDWLIGSELAEPFRNMKDPGALTSSTTKRPYPAKMSEFAQLPDTADADYGGVHCNSSIINHAFYLLAEGLDGAIGTKDAERVFFRCLTQHLEAQSQFIDCRLGCIAAAEELFGKDSTPARKTAQAFDAVEIFAAPTTPDPTPVPAVSGPDSTLFIYYNPFFDTLDLGRREVAQGDDATGTTLAPEVQFARPAVSGDGSTAFFVDPNFDLCGVETDNPQSRQCLGYPGYVHAVALSPDGETGAFVLQDPQTGQPDGKITVIRLSSKQVKTFQLIAPSADGLAVDTVLYADAMTFSTDGTELFYDALSQVKFGNGPIVRRWSIYSLNLLTEQTSIIVPPKEGVDTGNPALGRAGNRYLTYDALDEATRASSIMVRDMFTGEEARVATASKGFAYPSFLGDESGVIFAAPDTNALTTGYSLLKQDLASNRLTAQGSPQLWYEDAALGVIYRRGAFQGTNALPSVTLSLSAGTAAEFSDVILTADASDPDGTIAKVEFYNGSTKLGEASAPPFSLTWKQVPAGEYRLFARAIDNLGGSTDSSPSPLLIGTSSSNGPKLAVTALSPSIMRLFVSGAPGDYIISQSSDLKTWTDIYPVTVDANGTGTLDDSGGPKFYTHLFYRVRPAP